MHKMNRGFVLLIAVIALVATRNVFALAFTPTDLEWTAWTDYCRARYTVSGAGADSKFASAVPKSVVLEWEHKLEPVWYGLHHYCAGVLIFERARREKDAITKRRQYERVTDESSYALARASEKHPLYSTMLTTHARALFELGQTKQAFAEFERAIHLHPEMPEAYTAAGFLLHHTQKLAEARDMLQRGVTATNGGTAEMEYLLGLVLLQLKDFDNAVTHAQAAYSKGYPLPGLKRKLQAAGHWPAN